MSDSVPVSGEHRGTFQFQELRVKGFHDIFLGPHPDRIPESVDMGCSGHDNDRDGWMAIFHFLENGHAPEDRHIHFEQHACEPCGRGCLGEADESGYTAVFAYGLEAPLCQLVAGG